MGVKTGVWVWTWLLGGKGTHGDAEDAVREVRLQCRWEAGAGAGDVKESRHWSQEAG